MKVRVKQVRSVIGRPKNQKLTMQALGLNKIGQEREFESNPSIMGMIKTVNHLISVEEL